MTNQTLSAAMQSVACCHQGSILNPIAELTAQQRFHEQYVLVKEIADTVGVSRVAVLNAHRRGVLPEPIVVSNQVHAWERAEVAPYIEEWRASRDIKNSTRDKYRERVAQRTMPLNPLTDAVRRTLRPVPILDPEQA